LASEIGPDYRQVMNLIRERIMYGTWPVGRPIPSTPELMKLTGHSSTTVRRAVRQLQVDGILEGHPGKGVFARAVPEDADRERADLDAIGKLMAELRQKAEGYDDLRAKVNLMEAVLITLCARQGIDYPRGGSRDSTEKAPRRGRAG
jgi:DNA-binding GntR family transcriptional regulator